MGGDVDNPCSWANKTDVHLILKGYPTRIAHENKNYWCISGGPALARGGSGDILTGMLGALVAKNPTSLIHNSCKAVFWHGKAADMLARDKGSVHISTTQLFDYFRDC